MTSAMIDIETLATSPDAAIVAIGIAIFDQDRGVLDSKVWAIRVSDWHGEIDPTTVKWWSKQNEPAREFCFGGTHKALVVAQEFKALLDSWKPDEVWANDPDFDLVILRKWWKRVEHYSHLPLGAFPVSYKLGRSFRTITAEARRLSISYDAAYSASSVAHNPLDDACNQLRAVIYIRNQITGIH